MKTRRDSAYSTLREQLASGRFRPGDRLAEIRLANELGISRGPLREALNQLASEGLIQRAPGIGAFVPMPDPRHVTEAYEVRAAIESFTAWRAAECMTARGIEDLRALVEAMEGLVGEAESRRRWRTSDRTRMLDLDQQFHSSIVEAAGNQRLAKLLSDHRVLTQLLSYRAQPGSASTVETRREAVAEHRAIAEAISRHDPEAASACMRHHVASASRNALASIEKLEKARSGCD